MQRGFTLLELLVTLGIMVIGVLGITQMTILFLQLNADQKARVTAIALANEKLELIRNLPYTDVGTLGGIPPGNLATSQTITRNNIDFTVSTEIIYIDDPFDGLLSTTGSGSSIYTPSNSEVLYYWDMETNTDGQPPNIGNGTLAFTGTAIETGYQSNGLAVDSGDRIDTITTGNIDTSEGRIGIWYKPEFSNTSDDEYFIRTDTSFSYFMFRREANERLQFSFGNESVKSDNLTWNADQWYFLEAAWEGDDYRQIWRDGVPLAIRENPSQIPVLDTEMYIGHRGDGEGEVRGVIDELYILDNAHKYEIWGYNYSNPYQAGNPQVLFYWNMDSTDLTQTPQVGSGTISLGGDYSITDPGVKQTAIEFSNNGSPDTDHAQFPITDNLDLAEGRISFWFKPRRGSVNTNDDYLINATGCSSGSFSVTRDTSEKLVFTYGSATNNHTIESQAYDWENDFWHFIEIAWDAANDSLTLQVDGQEIASETSVAIDAPIGCTTLFFANQNSTSSQNGDGEFDDVYILDEAYPESSSQDTLNTDYKRAKVAVSWEGRFGTKNVYVITDIAPPGIETTAGGGTLVFNIFDANAQPVQGATIDILNTTLDPVINLSLTSDASGRLVLPGAPATSSSYQIFVSKAGYSTDFTASSTGIYTTPIRDHLSVLEADVTEVSFSIDKTSSLQVSTVSQTLPVNFQLNTDTTGESQTAAAIAPTATHFFTTWTDGRSGTTTQTYAQKYTFAGSDQWTGDRIVSGNHAQQAPRIIADSSGNQYIAWYDNSLGDNDIFIQKLSTDGIPQWATPVKVNGDTGSSSQQNPDLALFSNEVYVVWEDERSDAGDIYLQKVSSGGVLQFPSDVKINSDAGNNIQKNPRIQIDADGFLYISWLDNRSGDFDVYLDKVTASGSNEWIFEQQINSASAGTIDTYDIALDDEAQTHVVWNDNRSGNYTLYFQIAASSSALTFGSDRLLTTDAPSYNQRSPHIAATTNDDVMIGWHDDRGGDADVYVHAYDFAGNSVWTNDIKLNLETNADQFITDLGIYDGTRVVATWTDYSQGETNVWAGTLNYDGTELPAPFIDFILRGSKLTHQSPNKYKFEQTFTTDASGEITISDLEWDTYDIELNEPGVTTTQTLPALPINLSPDTLESIKLVVD